MAQEQAVETLGQSIDFSLHDKVIQAVRQHIENNLGKGPVLRHKHQARLI
jgi:DNA (cytosine-5)-methyltransferase 1